MGIPSRINLRLDPENEDDVKFYEEYSKQRHKKEWIVNCCLGYHVVTTDENAEKPYNYADSDDIGDDFLSSLGLDF